MTIQTIKSDIIDAVQNIHNEQVLNDLKKHIHEITEEERRLIEQIQKGVSPEITQRFDQLNHEQRERKLANVEEKELAKLVDTIEGATVKRLENMMKLAQIWNVSVDEVMEKLNIKAPEPHVW